MSKKYKVGDRVWTGSFYRSHQKNEIKTCIAEREVVAIYPNYCNKFGLRYSLVNVAKLPEIRKTMAQTGEPLSMFGAAYRPEKLFIYEIDARAYVQAQIVRELATLRELLGELPSLKTGEIHVKKLDCLND